MNTEKPAWTKAPPHRDDLAEAKAVTSVIADDDLRETMARLVEKALRVDRHK